MSEFFDDVWRGLIASPKYLQSKYFYDETGDAIFREIMECPEYYLTNCEMEIFAGQSEDLSEIIVGRGREFDIIELGPGDCSKSVHLLRSLVNRGAEFTYYPIDISEHVIQSLAAQLPAEVPGIRVAGLNGDYFAMLDQLKNVSSRNKVVLFLGSSIGNIPIEQTADFFRAIKSHLIPGDLILTGFDLVKDPETILAAYNDKGGITSRFNMNLLHRINTTLDADFDLTKFRHAPEYNEQTGACKSYLESLADQSVRIGAAGSIHFRAGEKIFMEISQKYTVNQIDDIAASAGFTVVHHFFDSKHWFQDALWQNT